MRAVTASLSGQTQAFIAAENEAKEDMVPQGAGKQCGPASASLHIAW
jgi:hypothetical protein